MSNPRGPEWDPAQTGGYPTGRDPAYSGQYPQYPGQYWGPSSYGQGYGQSYGAMNQPTEQMAPYWQTGPVPPQPPPPPQPSWLTFRKPRSVSIDM